MKRIANRRPKPSRAAEPYKHDGRQDVAKTSHGAVHRQNQTGSKFLMRAFKAKHGVNADSLAQAREWYAGYLADKDAAVRRSEAERNAERIARRFPWLGQLPKAA